MVPPKPLGEEPFLSLQLLVATGAPGPRGLRQPNFHLLPLSSHGFLLMCLLPYCKGNNRTEFKAYSNPV